jgi:nitrogen fixation-related uncharacterized protein
MFANSPAVVLLGLVIGLPALFLLLWAVVSGHFDAPDAIAYVIFEDGELNQLRPWETPTQARERVTAYGLPDQESQPAWKQWL